MRTKTRLGVAALATVVVAALAVILFYRFEDPLILLFTVQLIVLGWAIGGGIWLVRRAFGTHPGV